MVRGNAQQHGRNVQTPVHCVAGLDIFVVRVLYQRHVKGPNNSDQAKNGEYSMYIQQ